METKKCCVYHIQESNTFGEALGIPEERVTILQHHLAEYMAKLMVGAGENIRSKELEIITSKCENVQEIGFVISQMHDAKSSVKDMLKDFTEFRKRMK